jgi:YihY family inner membrane protein
VASVGDVAARAKLVVERARARYTLVDVTVGTFKRFSEDDAGVHAAALTYYMFFSVFPLLLFVASAIGYLSFLSDSLRANLLTAGVETFPLLDNFLTPEGLGNLQAARGTLAIVGLILALYSGSGAVVALEHALNRINGVTEERSFIPKRLNSLKWLALLGIAAVLSMGFRAVGEFGGDLVGSDVVAATLGAVGGLIAGLLVFLTAFRFLPHRELSWADVLPGAIVASVSFEILKWVGGLYLQQGLEGRKATFGAFASAAGLLVASYLMAQITLLAAELNVLLAERRARRKSRTTEKEA